MRDPAYENDVPLESESDLKHALADHTHVAELVVDSPYRQLRQWRCVKCLEPMFELDESPWWER